MDQQEPDVDDFFNEMIKEQKPVKKKVKKNENSKEKKIMEIETKNENSKDTLKELNSVPVLRSIETIINVQNEATLVKIFPEIVEPIIFMFNHEIDVCREISVSIILKFVKILKRDCKIILPFVFPVITSRIKSHKDHPHLYIETCEEVRYLLIKLLHFLSMYFNGEELDKYCNDYLKETFCKSFEDFHKINEAFNLVLLKFTGNMFMHNRILQKSQVFQIIFSNFNQKINSKFFTPKI
jgi:hypothetical protein